MFSARPLSQTADLSGATDVTVSDVETVTVSEAGVYVLRGYAGNACVIVATGDDDDVQLVLDGLQSSRRISHAFWSRTPTQTASTNGDLIITRGRIDVSGQSPFDYNGNCSYIGGTIIVNGTETNSVTNQMMGGMKGDMRGVPSGGFGGGKRR